MRNAAIPYFFVAALVLLTVFGCSGPPAASDPPDSSKVLDNPVIPPDLPSAPGPLAITSKRSSSSSPSETVVPFNPKSSDADEPHRMFLDGKQFMLGLINAERKKAGVPEVSLGDNTAAQIHAENSIRDCVSGHWGTDGLGPPMRYSLAGGYQSNRENVSGQDYCLTEEERPSYRPIQSVQSELRDHMDGYMGSLGHKNNILYPWHRKVNLGLAWDTHQMWNVQHFEGDYVDCSVPPTIEGATLRVSCTTKEVFPSDAFAQQIYYDPPSHALTRGQIARTYGYRSGNRVALLREQAGQGYYWPTNEAEVTHYSGCTPYDIDPTLPPPSSPDEATALYNAAKLCERSEETVMVPWITGEETIDGRSISLSHDIGPVLRKHGTGVYTLVVWGCSVPDSIDNPCEDDNSMPILRKSIFYGIDPPDTYTPKSESTPTPMPTPSATTQRADCGSAVADTSNAGLVSDCEILLGLKDTLQGSAFLNWSASLPITRWTGVRLGGTPQRVTIVKLQKRSLTGSIPAGLGSLTKLQDLWLYTNELTGPLPAELGTLSDLETLMLSGNDLSGQIPLTLNDLSLERLWLKGNNFTGCMPANLLEVSDGDAASLRLPTCESGTTTPTPTPSPTATPTPTTGEDFDLAAYLTEALCQEDDLREAFGESYTLDSDPVPVVWEHNGRGLWASVTSTWVSDSDSRKIVFCSAVVYDNLSSAILDSNYHSIRLFNGGIYDTLVENKIRGIPELGHDFIALHIDRGRREQVGEATVDRLESRSISSKYSLGDRSVIVAAVHYRNTDLSPLFQGTIVIPSVESVVEASRRIDARLSQAYTASHAVERDSNSVYTRGLKKAEDVPESELRGFFDLTLPSSGK